MGIRAPGGSDRYRLGGGCTPADFITESAFGPTIYSRYLGTWAGVGVRSSLQSALVLG